MEVEIDNNCNKENGHKYIVPSAPPLPNLPNDVPLTQGANLMRSAAKLIGKGDGKNASYYATESALDVCQKFVQRYERTCDCKNISWFYHNNDVEAHLQDGPTCGLVALKLAAQILKISSKSGEGEIEALLKVAQENGFTYHGEMFSAQDMGSLARKYYKLSCNVVENGLNDIEKLKEHLCMGHPVLVPYDADKNHEPCLKRGHKAHWAVITGFLIGLNDEGICTTATMDNTACSLYQFHLHKGHIPRLSETRHLFIIARQGKSRHYAMWDWVDLNNSNRNLFEFGQERTGNIERAKFTEGVQTGLCSKVVFLSHPSSN